MTALARFAFMALCAVPCGAAFDCTASTQTGPFLIWINEIGRVELGSAFVVEVASLSSYTDATEPVVVILVDGGGTGGTNMSLDECVLSEGLPSGGSFPISVDVRVCTFGLVASVQGVAAISSGSLVLAYATNGGLLPLQHLYLGTSLAAAALPTYASLVACPIPNGQSQHLVVGDAGTSLQLIGAASASYAGAALATLSWQGAIPNTLGALNNGRSQWGLFDETFDAVAPAPEQPCALGPPLGPSACSSACGGFGGTVPNASAAVQPQTTTYQPVLVFPPTGDVAACQPLHLRATTNPCTPAASCQATCRNGLLDAPESDADCGGGAPEVPGIVVVNGSEVGGLAAAAALVAHLAPFFAGAPRAAAAGLCARCLSGRRCQLHSDCDTGLGLLCAGNICTPAAFLAPSASTFVDVTFALAGLNALLSISGAADDTSAPAPATVPASSYALLQAGVARAATTSAVSLPIDPSAVAFLPSLPLLPKNATAAIAVGSGGAVDPAAVGAAAAADSPPVGMLFSARILVADAAAAGAAIAALSGNALLLEGLLQESLRYFAPLIGPLTDLSPATVAIKPYGGLLQPPAPGGGVPGGGPDTTSPAKSGPVPAAMSVGAVVGIAVGASALVAFAAVAAVMTWRRRASAQSERETSQRRAVALAAAAAASAALAAKALVAEEARKREEALLAQQQHQRMRRAQFDPVASTFASTTGGDGVAASPE